MASVSADDGMSGAGSIAVAILSVSVLLSGCGGGDEPSRDSGAGMDGGPLSDAATDCATAEDCDDGVFCNGAEMCTDGACALGEGPCGELGCDETEQVCVTECDVDDDADDDGVTAIACGGEDCDDTNPSVLPGAPEVTADGFDQDCDGGDVCFADGDADGFASGAVVASEDLDCEDAGELDLEAPDGDCDDTDATIFPGALEIIADGIDQSCDVLEVCYVDGDGDGFRANSSTIVVGSEDTDCADPGEADAAAPDGDCDDDDRLRNPFQPELPGDGIDSDCDNHELCYADRDADGYRSADLTATTSSVDRDCDDVREGSILSPGNDCDDDDSAIHPGHVEECDGVDENCDGRIDGWGPGFGGLPGRQLQRRCGTDVGICESGLETCTLGVWSSCSGDIEPAAVERCDGQDWDCDGTADDGCGCLAGQMRGCGPSDGACEQGTQTCTTLGTWGTCSGGVTPAAEQCNGVDDDCDGETDEADAVGCQIYVIDADADGYARPGGEQACLCAPSGAFRLRRPCVPPCFYPIDCDDDVAAIHPGAPELCGSVDRDCDGSINEAGSMGCTNYWVDVDGDGYGVGSSQCLCGPSGNRRAPQVGDCCDADSRVRPGATTWRSTQTACTPSCSGPLNCAIALSSVAAWDFDCDGGVERRYEAGAGCHGLCNDEDYGWIGPWPGCGGNGWWLDRCALLAIPPFCLFVPEDRTQTCR